MTYVSQLGALRGLLLEAAEVANILGGVDVHADILRLIDDVQEEIDHQTEGRPFNVLV